MNRTHHITRLLNEWSKGNREALDELIPLVYRELHRQAARFMRHENPGNTLQTTALIHEAYLKLVGQHEVTWKNRTQFFAIASNLMRRILVDRARARKRNKRGGKALKLPLEEAAFLVHNEENLDLIALDEALNNLAAVDERQARVVELHYFSGLSLEETAEALDISRSTVADEWAMAKAWLHRELTR